MTLRTRMIGLVGLFVALLLGVGAWGVRSTISMQDRMLEEHERLSRVEMNVMLAEVALQRQIEEWQNVLLRGHEPSALEVHWNEFQAEEMEARQHMEDTLSLLPANSVAAGLSAQFLRSHLELGGVYREALSVFKLGGNGAQLRGDGVVRGKAEAVFVPLAEVTRVVAEERQLMEGAVRGLTMQRSIATMVAIVLISLTALVVLALAMYHWMGLSILSSGRSPEDRVVSFQAPRPMRDEQVALAPAVWKRVVVADKDADVRQKFVREMKTWRCEVMEAGSATELAQVLELDGHPASGASIDLVVASDDLPGLEGMAVGPLLKSEDSTRAIPLVLRHANGGPPASEAEAYFAAVVSSKIGPEALKDQLMGLLKSPPQGEGGAREDLDLRIAFGRASKTRVLAAEDEPLNRKYLGLMLNKVGIEHEVVNDGEQAVDAMREGDYGVLLMDCGMPVLDGFEATRRIRDEHSEGEGPVVIGVTARTDEEAEVRGREVGMDAFVTKPVKLEFLCLVMEEELAKREALASG